MREAPKEGPSPQDKDREVKKTVEPATDSARKAAEDAIVELVGKQNGPEDFRMLIIYVNKNNTEDVRMDREDFADWEIIPLMHYVVELEFGLKDMGGEADGSGIE